MPRGSIHGEIGIDSISGASRFDVKYLFDVSNILPCAVGPVVGAHDSSDASGKFLSNIPYISFALVIASLKVAVP
jgi:hypothetical protein